VKTYLSNKDLKAKGLDAINPGFEIVSVQAGVALRFWDGFFTAGTIIDRTHGWPAQRQVVATIVPSGTGYQYKTNPGPKGAVRYGWAKTEEQAIKRASAWVRRRFAHVTKEVA
jgi:hypothetical protein